MSGKIEFFIGDDKREHYRLPTGRKSLKSNGEVQEEVFAGHVDDEIRKAHAEEYAIFKNPKGEPKKPAARVSKSRKATTKKVK